MGEVLRTAERIRDLNERTSDAICVTVNDRIAFANSSTLRLFGMQTAESASATLCLGSLILIFSRSSKLVSAVYSRSDPNPCWSTTRKSSAVITPLSMFRSMLCALDWDGAPAIKVSFR